MAAYSLDTLLNRWALHQLTTEQAVGQILQILHELEPRLIRLEQTMATPRVAPMPATPPQGTTSAPPPANVSKRTSRRRAR
jgi:hypothetical protein